MFTKFKPSQGLLSRAAFSNMTFLRGKGQLLVVGQLAVILRQAAFFAPVMDIRVHSWREKFAFLGSQQAAPTTKTIQTGPLPSFLLANRQEWVY